ncbi:MAG: trypsin alpha, partial [Polaromonas sp.]|nr:trypsin alpha [Polaromonas sp.]
MITWKYVPSLALALCPLTLMAQVEPLGWKAYKPEIFNGWPADLITSNYMVALLREGLEFPGGFICGASVIADGWALTAAHCVFDATCKLRKPATLYGLSGSAKLDPGLPRLSATNVLPHPDFTCVPAEEQIAAAKESRPIRMGNDIALVVLEGLKVSQRPLLIATDGTVAVTKMVASGWGTLGNASLSYQLMSVQLELEPQSTCAQAWQPSILSSDQLCVGPPAKGPAAGICSGDSGGPLVGSKGPTRVLAGLVSLGHLVCSKVDRPSLFTNVTMHRSW